MAGHVFVVQSDVTQLRCDAWLLPCDRRADPGEHWRRLVSLPNGPIPRPAGLAPGVARVTRELLLAAESCLWPRVPESSRRRPLLAGALRYVDQPARGRDA